MVTETKSLLRFALLGAPNSGKTAFFNAMTHAKKKSTNYPGVTVECHVGHISLENVNIELIDLPGLYSLQAQSFDECIARDFILGRPNKFFSKQTLNTEYHQVILVADATHLEKTLYLAMELKKLEIPFHLILTHHDVALKRGQILDLKTWSNDWNMNVFAIDCFNNNDLNSIKNSWNISKDNFTISHNKNYDLNIINNTTFISQAFKDIDSALKKFRTKNIKPETLTQKCDALLLHPWWGILAMLLILILVFQILFTLAAPLQDLIDHFFNLINSFLMNHMTASMFRDLLTDGVITGMGSVCVFLPQIALLSLMITLLEDSGYLARVAFLLDRFMKRLALPGKAIIPLLSSHACAIPGIMATRNLDKEEDRLTTMMIAPLTTCSARIPVYTLLISALVPVTAKLGWISYQALVMIGLYALGIGSSFLMGYILKKKVFKAKVHHLLVELPTYQLPRFKSVFQNVKMQSSAFLSKAGGIILVLSILIWILTYFPRSSSDQPHSIEQSYAGRIGKTLQPLLSPLGFDWKLSTALIPSFAAREVMVAALATVNAVEANDDEMKLQTLQKQIAESYSIGTIVALLIWFVFAPQCISTFAMLIKETNGYFWPSITFGYALTFAYLGALIAKLLLG